MPPNPQILLRSVPEGRRDLVRLGIALALALLPLPIGGLLSLAEGSFALPGWLAGVAVYTQGPFPGLARAARIDDEAVPDPQHFFDVGMAVGVWCLAVSLVALLWAYLRGSGLTSTNLNRPRSFHSWEPKGFGTVVGGITLLMLLALCWTIAATTLFHDGNFFVDALKTCSYAIGTGRDKHCLRYDFLPLPAALWKLGWTTGLGNVVLLVLTAGTWLLLSASRARSRRARQGT